MVIHETATANANNSVGSMGVNKARLKPKPKPKNPKIQRPTMSWVSKHQIGKPIPPSQASSNLPVCIHVDHGSDYLRAEISSTLVFGLLALHTHPDFRIHTRRFLSLSYLSQTNGTYTQGLDDVYFVFAWVVGFIALRGISIEWVLRPLAGSIGVSPKSHLRFAEQGWLVMYYGVFWTLGMVRCMFSWLG